MCEMIDLEGSVNVLKVDESAVVLMLKVSCVSIELKNYCLFFVYK